jgi:hypothetical protein
VKAIYIIKAERNKNDENHQSEFRHVLQVLYRNTLDHIGSIFAAVSRAFE